MCHNEYLQHEKGYVSCNTTNPYENVNGDIT